MRRLWYWWKRPVSWYVHSQRRRKPDARIYQIKVFEPWAERYPRRISRVAVITGLITVVFAVEIFIIIQVNNNRSIPEQYITTVTTEVVPDISPYVKLTLGEEVK